MELEIVRAVDGDLDGIMALVCACVAHMRARGYAAIRLDAFVLNARAVALYTGRGYRRAGEVRFRKGVFFVFEEALTLAR